MPLTQDRKILLSAKDGPEAIEIYTSEDEGVVDWVPVSPAVYIVISINGGMAKFGPFTLKKIYEDLKCQIT